MNRSDQAIRIGRFSLLFAVLAAAAISAPALADEYFDGGRMTAVLNGWGSVKVTAAANGGTFWVDRKERFYISASSYFSDQSHFHRGTCYFEMKLWEGGRLIQGTAWGYQTGYWETKTRRTTKTMSFAVNRLSRGRHYLTLKLKAKLNGKTKTRSATLVVDVR